MVLLEEYRALREEVTQRVAARMQMIGFAGVVSAVLVVANKFTFDGPSVSSPFSCSSLRSCGCVASIWPSSG